MLLCAVARLPVPDGPVVGGCMCMSVSAMTSPDGSVTCSLMSYPAPGGPAGASIRTLPPVTVPPSPPGRAISASVVPVGAVKGMPYLSNASRSRSRSLPGSAVMRMLSGTGRSTSDSAQRARTLIVTQRFPSPSWTAATRPGWSATSGRTVSTE